MYARGMNVREIQGFLAEQYGTEVSPEFISSVTDAVMAEVTAWQARPLEPMYPVVFFDCMRVKIREDAVVRNKAIYLALGILPDGTRDILGLWIENTEGAKFWMKAFNDIKTRGVADILITVTDGLKGMPEALAAVGRRSRTSCSQTENIAYTDAHATDARLATALSGLDGNAIQQVSIHGAFS